MSHPRTSLLDLAEKWSKVILAMFAVAGLLSAGTGLVWAWAKSGPEAKAKTLGLESKIDAVDERLTVVEKQSRYTVYVLERQTGIKFDKWRKENDW